MLDRIEAAQDYIAFVAGQNTDCCEHHEVRVLGARVTWTAVGTPIQRKLALWIVWMGTASARLLMALVVYAVLAVVIEAIAGHDVLPWGLYNTAWGGGG